MKHVSALFFLAGLFLCASLAAPVDNKDTDTNKDSKSAFGPAFDEIVVESHLTVRRKSNTRQSRTQNSTTPDTGLMKIKREIKLPQHYQSKKASKESFGPKDFGASSAHTQSQSFNSFGPIGSFGASGTSSQSQNFGVGPHGVVGGAAFSGTQQYTFNGQTVDVAFGNGFSNGGAVVTVTGPNGKKKTLSG